MNAAAAPLVVQKFGGSSLADADRIRRVARRIARERAQGSDLVVVVSAMGDATDELLALAAAVTDEPDERELDMLLATGEHQSATLVSMALHALGIKAISLTGSQAGITTDGRYGKARIAAIEPKRVKDELTKLVAPAEAIFLDAKIEAELAELADDDALELLQSMGQDEPGLALLARVGFDTLGLQTYLTAGPKEARAWTIHKGDTAPVAAGVIHTDFQRGFIKAEVVTYDDLVAAGSMAEARARGRVRIEGKDYVMRDGDVVEFRFQTTSGGKAAH